MPEKAEKTEKAGGAENAEEAAKAEKIEEIAKALQTEEVAKPEKIEEAEVEKVVEEEVKPTELAEGVFSFGVVTVGGNGDIVIPKAARDKFEIQPGDKLVVVGDVKKGLGIAKNDAMKNLFLKILGVIREVEKKVEGSESKE
ncbi:MAG: AbrB/MazE/SpoVT family DNA-binding domain-containing protein [Candidatus Hadarchaeota archaeon]